MHEYDMAVQLSASSQHGYVPSSACLGSPNLQLFLCCNGMLQKQLHTLTLATQIQGVADGMQTQATLQSVHSAFLMGPKERAVYLRRPLPKGRHAAEQSGEEEAGTVAGTNAAALRAWLRQVSNHAHTQTALVCSNPFCLYPSVHHAHTSSPYTDMQDSAVLLPALLGFSTAAAVKTLHFAER